MSKKLVILGLTLTLFRGGIDAAAPDGSVIIYPNECVSTDYIGNGVQWDPYQLDYGHGKMTISQADWAKMYRRLDYMLPGFIRVMHNTDEQLENGVFNPDRDFENLKPILDYCQSRGVTVMFGDWGGCLMNPRTKEMNPAMIQAAVDYLSYLVVDKGYSCIKYFDFVNEPNGYWASTDGDYDFWACGVSEFIKCLRQSKAADKVKLAAPDVAVWTDEECWWVEKTAQTFGEYVGVYDIHTYPSKHTVNSGEFYDMVKAYRDAAPADRKIIMGEIGLKYVHPADSVYNAENLRRAGERKYASIEDSQMSVYDPMYGIDTADALMQTVAAGYSGSVAWMLDDAMHYREERDKLKIWGFWNIFGEEFFGAKEENVRPWYYSWSLLCRYMPAGCEILKTSVTDVNCRATLVKIKDAYSIILLNPVIEDVVLEVKSDEPLNISDARTYVYSEDNLNIVTANEKIMSVAEGVNIQFASGYEITLPGRSLIVITNIKP